jgi:hypothetical protein
MKNSFRAFDLSAYYYSGCAAYDDTAVRGLIAHASGGFAANHHGGRPFGDGIRRADTSNHITDNGGWHFCDHDCGYTWPYNGAAHMGNRACGHGTGVHVG